MTLRLFLRRSLILLLVLFSWMTCAIDAKPSEYVKSFCEGKIAGWYCDTNRTDIRIRCPKGRVFQCPELTRCDFEYVNLSAYGEPLSSSTSFSIYPLLNAMNRLASPFANISRQGGPRAVCAEQINAASFCLGKRSGVYCYDSSGSAPMDRIVIACPSLVITRCPGQDKCDQIGPFRAQCVIRKRRSRKTDYCAWLNVTKPGTYCVPDNPYQMVDCPGNKITYCPLPADICQPSILNLSLNGLKKKNRPTLSSAQVRVPYSLSLSDLPSRPFPLSVKEKLCVPDPREKCNGTNPAARYCVGLRQTHLYFDCGLLRTESCPYGLHCYQNTANQTISCLSVKPDA